MKTIEILKRLGLAVLLCSLFFVPGALLAQAEEGGDEAGGGDGGGEWTWDSSGDALTLSIAAGESGARVRGTIHLTASSIYEIPALTIRLPLEVKTPGDLIITDNTLYPINYDSSAQELVITIPSGYSGNSTTWDFTFTPVENLVTKNGASKTYTATIYNGAAPLAQDTASYTAGAGIDWGDNNVGVNVPGGNVLAAGATALPEITFTYEPKNNYKNKTSGVEATQTVTFSDTITIPDNVTVTEAMINANGGVISDIDYYTSPNIKSFKVTYTINNTTTGEMPDISKTLTISGATVEATGAGPFTFAAGAATGTADGLTTTDTFTLNPAGVEITRAGGGTQPPTKPDIPAINKTVSNEIIAPAGSLLAGKYGDTVTYTLSGFANVAGEAVKVFTVTDNFTSTNTSLIALTGITPGTYSHAITPKIFYSTDNQGNWTEISSPYTIDTPITGITNIKYEFGDVPAGFSCIDGPQLTFKAVAGGGDNVTITNTAQAQYQISIGDTISSLAAQASVNYRNVENFTFGLNKSAQNKTTNNSGIYSPGDTVEYKLTITNNQNYILDTLEIKDYLEAAYVDTSTIQFTGATISGIPAADKTWFSFAKTSATKEIKYSTGTTDATDACELVWTLISPNKIPAKATVTIYYTVKIKDAAGTSLRNEFWVNAARADGGTNPPWQPGDGGGTGGTGGTGDPGDPITPPTPPTGGSAGNCSITLYKDIPSVGIMKKAENNNAAATYKDGDTVKYTITVKNLTSSGSAELKDFTVTDVLPKGLKYDAINTTSNPTVSADGKTLTWNLTGTSLDPGQTCDIVFYATIDTAEYFSGILTPSIIGSDPMPMNNSCYLYPMFGNNDFTYSLNAIGGKTWADGAYTTETGNARFIKNSCEIRVVRNYSAYISKESKKSSAADGTYKPSTTGIVAGTDRVTYRMIFKATGDTIHVTKFADRIPVGEEFVTGSFKVNGADAPDPSFDSSTRILLYVFATPIELAKDEQLVITFETKTEPSNAGTGAKTNYASFYTQEQISTLTAPSGASYGFIDEIDGRTTGAYGNWDNVYSTTIRYYTSCTVSYNGNMVAPQIEKKAYIQVKDGLTNNITWTEYKEGETNVSPGNIIGWQITATNLSTAIVSMTAPVIMDLLPAYVEWDSNSKISVVNDAGTESSSITPTEVIPNYNGGNQTLVKWTYTGSIAKNAHVNFRLTTTVKADFLGELVNSAYLAPQENFVVSSAGGYVNASSDTIIANGPQKQGVKATAKVMVSGTSGAVSLKAVAQGGLQASSGGFISVKRGTEVTYTLTVKNKGSLSYDKLVFIDRLPEPNDTGVKRTDESRGSQYSILLNNSSSDFTGATIKYSGKTSFTMENDYKARAADWKDTPGEVTGGVKSVRVEIGRLGQNETCTVTIKATVPNDAPIGATAWNSFAFYIEGRGDTSLEKGLLLEPMRVGVSVVDEKTGQLKIKKALEDPNPDRETKFQFDVIGMNNGVVVYDSQKDYPGGVVEIVLQNLPKVDGTIPLLNLPYGRYTVTERASLENIPYDSIDYDYNSVAGATDVLVDNGNSANAPIVTVTNSRDQIGGPKPTAIDVSFRKVDDNSNSLSGAAFSLSGNGYSKTVSSGGGMVSFSGVPVPGSYTLTETTVPDGYNGSSSSYTVTVTVDAAGNASYTITGGDRGTLSGDYASGYMILNTKKSGGGGDPPPGGGDPPGGGNTTDEDDTTGEVEGEDEIVKDPDIPEPETDNTPATTRQDSTMQRNENGSYTEIGPDGTPLGTWTYDEELEEWIFDPFVPLGNMPQTGSTFMMQMITMLLLGGAVLLMAGFTLKKYGTQKK